MTQAQQITLAIVLTALGCALALLFLLWLLCRRPEPAVIDLPQWVAVRDPIAQPDGSYMWRVRWNRPTRPELYLSSEQPPAPSDQAPPLELYEFRRHFSGPIAEVLARREAERMNRERELPALWP